MEFNDIVEFDYDNPSTYWVRGLMNEGLIKTYNPEVTFRYVCKALNNRVSFEKCKGYKMIIITEVELFNQLDQCMNCCGYYQSHKPLYVTSPVGTKLIKCFYASKYTRNQQLDGISTLSHFAPIYVEDKIIKNGFVPKSKNNFFNYPGRVHFFMGDKMDNETIQSVGNVLCAANMNDMNNGDYVLFTLDCNKIHSDVRFQRDQDWRISLFTYDNIPYNTVISRQYYHFDNPRTGLKDRRIEK